MPNPAADMTVQLVPAGDAGADAKVTVVADQVLTATPADVGKVVTVDADGQLVLAEAGGASSVVYTGSGADPITDANAARPTTDAPVYWLMANGVTPANADPGDIIWNADA